MHDEVQRLQLRLPDIRNQRFYFHPIASVLVAELLHHECLFGNRLELPGDQRQYYTQKAAQLANTIAVPSSATSSPV